MTLSVSHRAQEASIILPDKMSELPAAVWDSSSFVAAVMKGDDTELKLQYLLSQHPDWSRRMNATQLSDILRAWELTYDYMDVAPLEAWQWMTLHYVAPPADFRTGTVREFMYMHEYMEEGNMLELTALLYRRRSKDKEDAIKRDDMRMRLISRAQVSQEAKILQQYIERRGVQRMICGAYIYSIGTKHLIHDLYGSRIFSGEPSSSHNLGWMAVAMQVAEHGVFGDYEHVLDTTLHEVLSYMVVKQSEADASKSSMPEAPVDT